MNDKAIFQNLATLSWVSELSAELLAMLQKPAKLSQPYRGYIALTLPRKSAKRKPWSSGGVLRFTNIVTAQAEEFLLL